jgi:predicted enzyme related to lactoylglutathione lyase
MENNANMLNWFEIYVSDLERAKKFYETILDIKMEKMEMGDMKMYAFPYAPGSGKVSGALVQHAMRGPSEQGALIYINGNPNLQKALDKVEAAGGKVTMPKTKITDDIGYMAFFVDSEGNGMGLHSRA